MTLHLCWAFPALPLLILNTCKLLQRWMNHTTDELCTRCAGRSTASLSNSPLSHTHIWRLCLFLGHCWRKETKAHKLYLHSCAFSTNIHKTDALPNLVNILSRERFRKSVCSRNLTTTSALFPRCHHTSHELPLSHRAKHPFSEEIFEKSRRLFNNN